MLRDGMIVVLTPIVCRRTHARDLSRSGGIQRRERSELANTGGFRQQTQYGTAGAVLRHREETGTAVTLPRGERPGTHTRVFGRYLSVCHLQSARAGKSVGESHETSVLLRTQRDDAARCSSTFISHTPAILSRAPFSRDVGADGTFALRCQVDR